MFSEALLAAQIHLPLMLAQHALAVQTAPPASLVPAQHANDPSVIWCLLVPSPL